MLPGHYVTHDGRAWQVGRLITSAAVGAWGVTVPATTYDLRRAGESVYITAPDRLAAGVTPVPHPQMIPACGTCSAATGYPCDPECVTGTDARATLPA